MEVGVDTRGISLIDFDDRQELLAGDQDFVLMVQDAGQVHASGRVI